MADCKDGSGAGMMLWACVVLLLSGLPASVGLTAPALPVQEDEVVRGEGKREVGGRGDLAATAGAEGEEGSLDIQDVQTAFAVLDMDRSGTLSPSELRLSMEHLSLPLTEVEIHALFSGGGAAELTKAEFMKLLG